MMDSNSVNKSNTRRRRRKKMKEKSLKTSKDTNSTSGFVGERMNILDGNTNEPTENCDQLNNELFVQDIYKGSTSDLKSVSQINSTKHENAQITGQHTSITACSSCSNKIKISSLNTSLSSDQGIDVDNTASSCSNTLCCDTCEDIAASAVSSDNPTIQCMPHPSNDAPKTESSSNNIANLSPLPAQTTVSVEDLTTCDTAMIEQHPTSPVRSLHVCAAPWRPGLKSAPVQLREGPTQAYHRSILAILNRVTDTKMDQLVRSATAVMVTGNVNYVAAGSDTMMADASSPAGISRDVNKVRRDFISMLFEKAQDEEMYSREYSRFLFGLCRGVDKEENKTRVKTFESRINFQKNATNTDDLRENDGKCVSITSTSDADHETNSASAGDERCASGGSNEAIAAADNTNGRKSNSQREPSTHQLPPVPSLSSIVNQEYLRRFNRLYNQLRTMYQGTSVWRDSLEVNTRRQIMTHLQLGVQLNTCCSQLPLATLQLIRDLLLQPLETLLLHHMNIGQQVILNPFIHNHNVNHGQIYHGPNLAQVDPNNNVNPIHGHYNVNVGADVNVNMVHNANANLALLPIIVANNDALQEEVMNGINVQDNNNEIQPDDVVLYGNEVNVNAGDEVNINAGDAPENEVDEVNNNVNIDPDIAVVQWNQSLPMLCTELLARYTMLLGHINRVDWTGSERACAALQGMRAHVTSRCLYHVTTTLQLRANWWRLRYKPKTRIG